MRFSSSAASLWSPPAAALQIHPPRFGGGAPSYEIYGMRASSALVSSASPEWKGGGFVLADGGLAKSVKVRMPPSVQRALGTVARLVGLAHQF